MSAMNFLARNKTTIQKVLMADRQLILDKCLEKMLVTDRDYKNLRSINKGTESDHVIGLMDNIRAKGEKRCHEFLCLLKTDEDVKETFPDLEEVLVNYTASLPSPVQESTSTAETADVAQDNRPKPDKDNDEPYPLRSKPTGLCFIINNVNFNKPRRGSDVDAENLAKVFSWLGFRVLMCEDQTKDQMDRVLKCLSSATDISNLLEFKVKEWSDSKFTDLQEVPAHGDAFICCILTHGNMGVVCGTDMQRLAIKEIKKTFKASTQSPLTNKPKVFLIQACQGGQLHGAVMLTDGQSDDEEADASIPEECDFLVGIATVEDYKSYRNPVLGSRYIQSVCKQLWKHCPSGVDIVTILHHVNDEVSQQERTMKKTPGVVLKQMPEIKSTLRKKLVFSPHSN